MIIENLSQLYPKGYLSKTIGSEATYSIPVDDQFFIVNKAFLSIKEQHLLEALSRFLKTQQLLVTILGSVTYFNRQNYLPKGPFVCCKFKRMSQKNYKLNGNLI